MRSHPSKIMIYILAVVLAILATLLIAYWATHESRVLDEKTLLQALMVGAAAQLVDGALGMAYGITATTFLLTTGTSPLLATASVHIAEMFTTAASGLTHWHKGNINKQLFLRLLLPGVIGGVAGVMLVTQIDSHALKPWMAGYLGIMGFYIIIKAFRKIQLQSSISSRKVVPLAFFGAFVDAVGGGGWGPIVTTTLLGSGHEPKSAIGSVNAAEFFITAVTGFSFALIIGVARWEIPAGLIIGGIFAAPFAVHITSRLPIKALMLFVGMLICGLSSFTLYSLLK